MTTNKSNGANVGAVMKVGIRIARNKPPKRRPYGYEDDTDDNNTDSTPNKRKPPSY